VQQTAEVAVHRWKYESRGLACEEFRQLALDLEEELALLLGAQADEHVLQVVVDLRHGRSRSTGSRRITGFWHITRAVCACRSWPRPAAACPGPARSRAPAAAPAAAARAGGCSSDALRLAPAAVAALREAEAAAVRQALDPAAVRLWLRVRGRLHPR